MILLLWGGCCRMRCFEDLKKKKKLLRFWRPGQPVHIQYVLIWCQASASAVMVRGGGGGGGGEGRGWRGKRVVVGIWVVWGKGERRVGRVRGGGEGGRRLVCFLTVLPVIWKVAQSGLKSLLLSSPLLLFFVSTVKATVPVILLHTFSHLAAIQVVPFWLGVMVLVEEGDGKLRVNGPVWQRDSGNKERAKAEKQSRKWT